VERRIVVLRAWSIQGWPRRAGKKRRGGSLRAALSPSRPQALNRLWSRLVAGRRPVRLQNPGLRSTFMNGHTWFFWALASAFFAALTAIFAKAGLQGIDSDFATFIRTLVILAALALFLTWAGKWQGVAAFTARNWLFLVLSGLATGASWLAYFKALQLGDASRVAPVDKFSLVLVALLAVVFLGERPRPHEWGGLGLVAAGMLVLAIKR